MQSRARRFRRCEIPAGVALRDLAADWYVRADRYILACLTEIARLAFAARWIYIVCDSFANTRVYFRNKFLTVI